MKATAAVLAKAEDARFRRAVWGVRKGVFTVKVTLRNEDEIRGFVRTPNGTEYGCTITEAGTFCSCPDAQYRGFVCKHAVVLALYDLRNPPPRWVRKPAAPASPEGLNPAPDLKLVKARREYAFSP